MRTGSSVRSVGSERASARAGKFCVVSARPPPSSSSAGSSAGVVVSSAASPSASSASTTLMPISDSIAIVSSI